MTQILNEWSASSKKSFPWMKLKSYLSKHRLCDVCNKPVVDGGDLHEGILKRSDVSPRIYENDPGIMFNPINCSLLHHECHMAEGQNPALRDIIVSNRVAEGYPVEEWLAMMAERGSISARCMINFYKNNF